MMKNMKKDVFARHYTVKDFLFPLIVLPYGFWAIYFYENGFDWIVGVLGAVLFFIILPLIIVFWDKK